MRNEGATVPNLHDSIQRRQFLKRLAAGAAAVGLPALVPGSARGAAARATGSTWA